MKLSALTPLLLAATAAVDALAIWPGANTQAPVLSAGLKVPGSSPLEFCDANRDADLLTIELVNLSPNPPVAGKNLTIEAVATVNGLIEPGAYVRITVKYGLIQLLSTTADLCEQLGNVDLQCPIEKGKTTITKEIEMPAQIPPGTYNVFADAYSSDDEHITCLKASVNFPRPSFA